MSVARQLVTASPEELAGRAGVYRLLARLWMYEADGPLLEALAAPPLREIFEAAGGVPPETVDASLLEALAVDYCQLFLGPQGQLPAYQSVFSEGRFQATPEASMQSYLDASGYDESRLPDGMMKDHLAVQLDLMGHLLSLAASVTPQDTDQGSVERTQDGFHPSDVSSIARQFFRQHLDWPGPLFEAAERKAESDFYRSMIRMTAEFLRLERDSWSEAE